VTTNQYFRPLRTLAAVRQDALDTVHKRNSGRAAACVGPRAGESLCHEALVRSVEALLQLQSRTVAPATFAARFERVLAAVSAAVVGGAEPAKLSRALEPVRCAVAQSPLVRRLQTWPRGYQGDFETIDAIVSRRNRLPPGTFAHAAEQWALDCAPCEQHRNKVAAQAAIIERTLAVQPAARILSVASGPNCDVRRMAATITRSEALLVLNDSDPDAIAFSRGQFSQTLNARCAWVQGNVFNRVRQIEEQGPYDLIVVGGLCDYLTDRQCSWLLNQLTRMMAPASRLFFTNIADGNPYRICMEHVTAWRLIERSAASLCSFVNGQGVTAQVVRDVTSLAHLVTVVKS
jgi:extracellular factor (EF) 3-hydroxypalmitic acid methyl ester biosynthesis protein